MKIKWTRPHVTYFGKPNVLVTPGINELDEDQAKRVKADSDYQKCVKAGILIESPAEAEPKAKPEKGKGKPGKEADTE